MRRVVGIALCTTLLGSVPAQRSEETDSGVLRDSIVQILQEQKPADPDLQRQLTALYRAHYGTPRWIAPSGRLTESGRQALRALTAAADDGLDPSHYDIVRLRAIADCWPTSGLPVRSAAEFDVTLSIGFIRFARELRGGRADVRALGLPFRPLDSNADLIGDIQDAIDRTAIDQFIRAQRPALAQYEALRVQLMRYRLLMAVRLDPAALPSPAGEQKPVPARPTRPVVEYLVATGDLAPVASDQQGMVDLPTFRAALERFQRRHGLKPDGVIGPATRAALLVPFDARTRQIELALERLRWLPRVRDQRVVVINIPMFQLWGWEPDGSPDAPSITMGVVVGRARRTPTPVLAGDLREVIFRPYWNVPRSILIGELLPAIRRDPTYLAREGMEIVRGDGDDARRVEASAENLERLRAGELRLRQRPGARNALGLVKFVLPNPNDVYLHDTPERSLFDRARRDFSHGCVRVENPVALAQWVLGGQPEWAEREQLLAATMGTNNRHVAVADPPKVFIVYTTAVVVPEDGSLHFADDIYGQDILLDRTLRRPRVR